MVASSTSSDQQPAELPREPPRQDEDAPACQSCRRKKAKCSRGQPCSQCVRFHTDCIYNDRRHKPGLRVGAVEQLQKRVDTLEKMFLGQGLLWQQVWESINPGAGQVAQLDEPGHHPRHSNKLAERQNQLKDAFLQSAQGGDITRLFHGDQTYETSGESSSAKRRKTESVRSPLQGLQHDMASEIIESDLLDQLVEFYFANIHHWIPILHLRRFREQIRTSEGRQSAVYILHAIIAVCIRFSGDSRLGTAEDRSKVAEASRQKVILSIMEAFSVESLQASVIVAFDTICRGRGPSSWSIVGSMARTVEQLQLSVEEENLSPDGQSGEILIRRMGFLSPSQSWREAEGRRRLFWAVFLMDRFCNVSTGWNVSLTSVDVKRRLPCEGTLWQREEDVQAPYFGISDTKGASSHSSPLIDTPVSSTVEMNSTREDVIGGYAYCIEATETLALVTNFFLHHALDIKDAGRAQLWLLRFKELDLRMAQWKLFLPQKWRDASALNADGFMDPNLTLAHMTHNTAVILLHQGIAYPPQHWRLCPVRLPSASSAETCVESATEISNLGSKFLSSSPIPASPQFSFCLFIAGRLLLAHSSYNKVSVSTSLESIILSLFEISGRWAGPRDMEGREAENLASGFAKRLFYARPNFSISPTPSLDIRQTVYYESNDQQHSHSPGTTNSASGMQESILPAVGAVSSNYEGDFQLSAENFDQFSLMFPPLPLSFQQVCGTDQGMGAFCPGTATADHISPLSATVEHTSKPPGSWSNVPATL